MAKKKSVSILGCGWLGMPLGEFLGEQGFHVKGSTTTLVKMRELVERGILPFLIDLNPEPEGYDMYSFLKSEILIIDIPPGTRTENEHFHPRQAEQIIRHVRPSPVKKIIYISSTSVYPNIEAEVDENTPAHPSSIAGQAILKAEEILQSYTDVELTILRCGGLMGYDRVPGKYFAGRKGLTTGQIPVNFVHRDDVIRIIYEIIEQEKWGEIFNVVAPEHPLRQDIYMQNALEFQFETPEFVHTEPSDYKIVHGQKLIEALNYTYIYPDPLSFRYSSEEEFENEDEI